MRGYGNTNDKEEDFTFRIKFWIHDTERWYCRVLCKFVGRTDERTISDTNVNSVT